MHPGVGAIVCHMYLPSGWRSLCSQLPGVLLQWCNGCKPSLGVPLAEGRCLVQVHIIAGSNPHSNSRGRGGGKANLPSLVQDKSRGPFSSELLIESTEDSGVIASLFIFTSAPSCFCHSLTSVNLLHADPTLDTPLHFLHVCFL